ncbi:MAG: hypothetical protein ACFFEY_14250 [Candidatus Thorarchaeota archaeon]
MLGGPRNAHSGNCLGSDLIEDYYPILCFVEFVPLTVGCRVVYFVGNI